eukprot:6275686-Amphidinium_carterae.1
MQEVLDQRKDALTQTRWQADSSGVVKETAKHVPLNADISDSMRVFMALHRRGIAYDIAGVLSWDAHDQHVQ